MRGLFDLDTDPAPVAAALGSAPLIGPLVRGDPGRRVPGGVTHLFPRAAALTSAAPALPGARVRALRALAWALASGDVVLDPAAPGEDAVGALLALPGIGPWTAGYVAMRALGDADAFLPTALGVRRALERLGHSGDPRSAAELAERWRPYRAYANQHLWAVLG